MVNFVPAVTYHFCLNLPASFTKTGRSLLASPCKRVGLISMLLRGDPTWGPPNSDAASSVLVKRAENERPIGSPIDFRVIYHGGSESDLFSGDAIIEAKQPRIPFAASKFQSALSSPIHPSPICGSRPSAKPLSLSFLPSFLIL